MFYSFQIILNMIGIPAPVNPGLSSESFNGAALRPMEFIIAGLVLAVFLGIYTIITLKKDEDGCCGGNHSCHVCACGRKIRDVEETDS